MHDSFEKEVHQKMEELRLTPSAPVWERIEVEIRPEKKRRGLFWLWFAGLLLLGGGWWGYEYLGQPGASTMAKNSKPSLEEGLPSHSTAGTSLPKPAEESVARPLTIPAAAPAPGSQPPTAGFLRRHPMDKAAPSIAGKAGRRRAVFSGENTSGEQPVEQGLEVKADPAPLPKVERNVLPEAPSNELQESKTPALSIDSGKAATETPSAPLPAKPADSATTKKVAAARSWQKQFDLKIGKSSYVDRISIGPVAMYYASPNSSVTGAVPAQPSGVSSGLSFAAHISFVKVLNAHWDFSAGIGYSYSSTRQRVGERKQADTVVQFSADKVATSSFYTNTGSHAYTNAFHVLELPLTIRYKPAVQLPLYLCAGVAYGRLLYTNALTYSSASNLYYRNEQNYLHNQLPVSAALQVEVFGRKKAPVRIGPAVQYNLLKLRKENGSSQQHLSFVGVQASLQLKK